MPFVFRIAAQTFQRFIDQVLHGLDFVFVYIDVILVASSVTCRPADSTLDARDYADQPSGNVDAPGDNALPNLRRFLGIADYYCRFIPNCSDMLKPLTDLLQNNPKKFVFTPETTTAFNSVNTNEHARLVLETDASQSAVGAVLQQIIGDEIRPLFFFSRKLQPAAAIRGTSKWVAGFGTPIELHSDQGAAFESRLLEESNGMVERTDRTVMTILRAFIERHQSDRWDEILQQCLLAYRAAVHSSTGYMPSLLTLGHEVRLPIEVAHLRIIRRFPHDMNVPRTVTFDSSPGLTCLERLKNASLLGLGFRCCHWRCADRRLVSVLPIH
ncbi:uncharacterized protein DEA37_0004111 [Paragonimus westermani]|uniref:Reverse transcriptase/retrotransposon-derived protein RNase H-like domain-containing protein n=1 Tax=Paragonimus westermani TaxID=34504 RepID=A0A5J4N5X2_9TREM|nr:uncharacterized protein DEA37_0004111 [Paragonimus westermani]